jgi:hypothetical protein
MTEYWTGYYVYGDGYSPEDVGKKVAFAIEWENVEGELKGTCTDEDTVDFFNRPSTVKGFIEGDFISFIKKYPCSWTIIDGEFSADENLPAPDIHYSGYLIDNHFEGEWEMTASLIDEEGIKEYFNSSGTWYMTKK